MSQNIKISILIPAYNSEKTIRESLASALIQDYPIKEILICDDASTDKTVDVVKAYAKVNSEIRLIVNEKNLGIGRNLQKLMEDAHGKYVLYLCADDLLTNKKILSDIVNQFDKGDPAIGIIGRFYYFFMDGHSGAIGVCRERNIFLQSCCPSGMAFRKDEIVGTNKIFVEMPSIVGQYLKKWRWTMFEYDTIAARFKPGTNTGTKKSYYTESPTQNWIDLVGKGFSDYPMFVQLRNRAPKLLWREIKLHVKNNKKCLQDISFWFYAVIAVVFPGFILRPLTRFYRHRITRRYAKIIERGV